MLKKRRNWLADLFALSLCVSVAGCHLLHPVKVVSPPLTNHQSPNLDPARVRRVLMLPPDNQSGYPAAGARFAHVLHSELATRNAFEVVRLDPWENRFVQPEMDVRDGRFNERLLVDLRAAYHVDAVLFVTLKEFYPYRPPRVGVSAFMVDTTNGEVLSSVDGMWDGRNEDVLLQAYQFFEGMSAARTLGNADLMLQSPEYWSKFVCHQLVCGLVPTPQQATLGEARLANASASVNRSPSPWHGQSVESIDTPPPQLTSPTMAAERVRR